MTTERGLGAAPVVQASEVGFRYRDRAALRDVTFELRPGVTGLVGINGAGKSTLLRLLATTAAPAYGSLELFGADAVRGRSRARRHLGYMPQSLAVPAALRVCDFLGYMAWLRGFRRSERPALVDAALGLVELADRSHEQVGSLSGGMHRRMLLAQAILGDPDLLLLDEPTAGLDPEQRVRVRELIARTAAGRAVVVSSHLMEDLVPVADRVLMLHEGRLVFDDTMAALGATGAELVRPGSGLSPHEAAFLSLCSAQEPR